MRSKSILISAAAALLLTACGGSGATSKTSGALGAKASRPSAKYVVKMTGRAETPAGAPDGVGVAIIALHDSVNKVCWRFSHLHGFVSATYAHIHHGAKGKPGPIVIPLSTASKLHHGGCVTASATLLAAIAKDPSAYYVNIHSAKYPQGAVRAQL